MIWLAIIMCLALYGYLRSAQEVARTKQNSYRRPRYVRPASHAGRPPLFRAPTAGRILR